jgi:hypothetical protein
VIQNEGILEMEKRKRNPEDVKQICTDAYRRS